MFGSCPFWSRRVFYGGANQPLGDDPRPQWKEELMPLPCCFTRVAVMVCIRQGKVLQAGPQHANGTIVIDSFHPPLPSPPSPVMRPHLKWLLQSPKGLTRGRSLHKSVQVPLCFIFLLREPHQISCCKECKEEARRCFRAPRNVENPKKGRKGTGVRRLSLFPARIQVSSPWPDF